MRKCSLFLLAIFSLVLGFGPAANADSETFTVSGTTSGGAVKATVTISTQNGFLQVVAANEDNDPANIAQVLTALEFTLTNAGTTDGLGTPSSVTMTGVTRDINGNGTFTQTSSGLISPGWGAASFSGGLEICAGAPSSCALKPDGIIGSAGHGDTIYDGNSSLVNGGHTPEALGTDTAPVVFNIYASGVTSSQSVNSLVSGLTGVFGTGNEAVTGTPGGSPLNPVPEPGSMLLLVPGVMGLAFKLRNQLR